MNARLRILSIAILVVMIAVTTWASLHEGVFSALQRLVHDRWGLATLADAYCGFLIFYAWVASRERTLAARAGWFVAIMALGNIATAAYLLLKLSRLREDAKIAQQLAP